jgi:hypothetical protein
VAKLLQTFDTTVADAKAVIDAACDTHSKWIKATIESVAKVHKIPDFSLVIPLGTGSAIQGMMPIVHMPPLINPNMPKLLHVPDLVNSLGFKYTPPKFDLGKPLKFSSN